MSIEITSHVRLDDKGVAWIDDTNVKVIEVVVDQLAHGSSPEEIHFQYPHLSLAQIHGALSYYFDHQAAMDQEIARQLQEVDAAMARSPESPLIAKLRRAGKLP